MDDFKRELYTRARVILKEGIENCVCWSFMSALKEIGATDSLTVENIFPEFFSLDDQIQWHDDSDMKYKFTRPAGIDAYWWRVGNLAPRLRIIDCILNSY